MNTYHEFVTVEEALAYRHEHGTGGWIFAPDDDQGFAVLFPPSMTPTGCFNHPLAIGRSGKLLANA